MVLLYYRHSISISIFIYIFYILFLLDKKEAAVVPTIPAAE
jgi:hypothetical protein